MASAAPSVRPSVSPAPTVSKQPSVAPSVSSQPSISLEPSIKPSAQIQQQQIIETGRVSSPVNDDCSLALSLPLDGTIVAGTTNFATIEKNFQCGLNPLGVGVSNQSPVVWYSVKGNGNIFEVSTCSNATDFGTAIQVLTGGCESLSCLPGAGAMFDRACGNVNDVRFPSRVRIETVVDKPYYVMVFARLAGEGKTGNFGIHVDEIKTPPNDRCEQAVSLQVSDTKINVGSTLNATVDSDRKCGLFNQGGVNNASPGIWYSTVGNGKIFEVTTCSSETNFNTAIQVLDGECDLLRCVPKAGSSTDSLCPSPRSSRVTFGTVVGRVYYIYVFGKNGSDTGKFILSLSESNGEVPQL